jgi:hypothetical protein
MATHEPWEEEGYPRYGKQNEDGGGYIKAACEGKGADCRGGGWDDVESWYRWRHLRGASCKDNEYLGTLGINDGWIHSTQYGPVTHQMRKPWEEASVPVLFATL